jgi:hypothetical protein
VIGGANGTMANPAWDPGQAPLGTLIFRAGLLTEEQIQDSLREGERTGKRLGEVLVERGLLSEKEVTRLLAKQRGVEFVDLEARSLDRNAAQLLRTETARRYRALPFAFENGTPLVAVTDVADEMAARAVQEELARDVRFVLAGQQDLAEAITKAYAPAAEPALTPVVGVTPAAAENHSAESRPDTPPMAASPPVAPLAAEPTVEQSPPSPPPVRPIAHELHVVAPSPPPADEPGPQAAEAAPAVTDALHSVEPPPAVAQPVEPPPPARHPVEAAAVPDPVEPPAAVTRPVEAPPAVAQPVGPPPAVIDPIEVPPVLAHPVEAPPAVAQPVEAPPAATPKEAPPIEAAEPAGAEALHWGGSLGELLLESGLLTREQLDDALREAARRGRRLGEIVLERGWVHERTLAHCLASQKGLPFVSLRDRSPEPEAVKLLPRKTAHLYAALPVELDGPVPVVAISDPTNEAAMASVRTAFRGEIRFAVAATSELASALDRAYDALEPAPVVAAPESNPEPEPTQGTDLAAEPRAEAAPSDGKSFHVAIRLMNSEAVSVGTYASAADAEAEAAAVVKRLASTGPAEWPSFRGRFLRPDAIVSVDVVAES